jgi:hypothetical protein
MVVRIIGAVLAASGIPLLPPGQMPLETILLVSVRDHVPKCPMIGVLLAAPLRPGMGAEQILALLGNPDGSDSHGPPGEFRVTYVYHWYGICVTVDPQHRIVPNGVGLPVTGRR